MDFKEELELKIIEIKRDSYIEEIHVQTTLAKLASGICLSTLALIITIFKFIVDAKIASEQNKLSYYEETLLHVIMSLLASFLLIGVVFIITAWIKAEDLARTIRK